MPGLGEDRTKYLKAIARAQQDGGYPSGAFLFLRRKRSSQELTRELYLSSILDQQRSLPRLFCSGYKPAT